MPGIVGLITNMQAEHAKQELACMVGSVRHESFYVTGAWADESLGVYVGWAVHKNSFGDAMPYHNEGKDVYLFFAGEEYPEPGTADRLKKRGHSLGSEKPSYLVHLYEDDPNFPVGLNGRFHGLLTDRTRRTATLFNDRYGMHRLYYHQGKEAFYFASEAKAIVAVRPELRSPLLRSLGELVACGCVLEDRTIFDGIKAIPGGAAWVFRGGSIERKGTYFQPQQWEQQSPLDAESFYHEVRDTFSRNLSRYFNGQQRIGVSLTGGLDTRAIMSWWKGPPNSLSCYTFGGMLRECHDIQVARRVARVCQQSHEVITVGDEFLSRFPHYAERSVYLAEGAADVSRSSDLYVSERAREIAPVKVVGTYGSEILRQTIMFKPIAPVAGVYIPEFLSYVGQARATWEQLRNIHPVTFAAFRQFPWYHFGVLALEQSQLTVRSPYLDNNLVQVVFRAPHSTVASDPRLRLIREGNPALARIRSDRGIGDNGHRLSGALSRCLLDFTFKAEYAYDYGMPQWIASIDHLLSPWHLERFFLGRHKLLHFRVWYQNALSEYVQQVLLDPQTLSRPYLERKGVEAMVHRHLRGDRNFTTDIHRLLTLEHLHRLFFDPR
jgi:asparagine synthase (glutamine-hydrolysing)